MHNFGGVDQRKIFVFAENICSILDIKKNILDESNCSWLGRIQNVIIRSRFLPQIFGILLMIMGIGFGTNILDKFLVPQFYPALFTQFAMLGGALGAIPTMLWLLIAGAKAQPIKE